MQILGYTNYYFIGIGGIGMSALARFFNENNKKVAGYDRYPTELTKKLENEGIQVHFDDSIKLFPFDINAKSSTLIIYTPAVPYSHSELTYFINNGFDVKKRSEVLGLLTHEKYTIAVSGTHGKTTISTITSHILYQAPDSCSSFLGGISKNYNSNLLLSPSSKNVVVEADEFDRSFLQLSPDIAIISSIDADHLDIYNTYDEIKRTFTLFANKIKTGGTLIYKEGLELGKPADMVTRYTYSLNSKTADFYADNIKFDNFKYYFDIHTPFNVIKNLSIGLPCWINIENSVAATAIACVIGISEDIIRQSLDSFQGVKRRFDIQALTDKYAYIDDYAHHPKEIEACILSARKLFPGKKITGIFQPHLYSRTRDLAEEFAQSLNLLDNAVVLDIYPARELPIEGVTSSIILDKMKLTTKKLCSIDKLESMILADNHEIILTMGAGDIGEKVEVIKSILEKKNR